MEGKIFTAAELFAALGCDALKVQKRWNEEHILELERTRELLPVLRGGLGDAALNLSPRRLVLDSMSIEHRTCISTSRERGLAIKLKPLNLGYDLRYGSTASSESRLCVTVEQVPIQRELK